MSFHEKSAWACLIAIILVFVPYFLLVFSVPGYPIVVPAFVAAVVVLVLLLSAAHLLLAVTSARIRRTGDVPPPDEREMAIELKSTRIAAYVLASVVMVWCVSAYAGIPLLRVWQQRVMAEASPAQAAPVPAENHDASSEPDQQLPQPELAAVPPAPPTTNLPHQRGDAFLSHALPIPAHAALLAVHVLFAGFVLANVIYYASLVIGYRTST